MLREITLISVGSLKKDYLKRVECEYKAFVKFINIKDSNIELESDEILKFLNKHRNLFYVLFDLKGDKVDTNKINYLKNLNNICFIIGGSDGVCDNIRSRCNLVIKLSDFTYSHQIFRLIALSFIKNVVS